ncbi:TlpA disulfide reductase family protein [uncultured Algoriphagus sp.]|uniref:TlpA family protein disulfide reductase n=1 Tax=uncultured Algoriphagus sp. TaxID=417365 RepID=UPI0030EDB378
MKKNILTCFLASLCLYGSTSTAKVADSPGADFLHRSQPQVSTDYGDTHRGGETRSDTLSIGDQMPSGIEFSDVLQYDSDKLKLEDFEGKYLVFQFWATWCTASSGFLPELDKLQQQFGDDLQILPITYQPREEVIESIALRPVLQNLDFPLIVGDNRLRKVFPHVTFPHLVIIDPQGEVVAITGSQDFTAAHIIELLSDGSADFRTKVDEQVSVDMDERLISGNTHIPNKNIRYQSALTSYIPGVPGSTMDSREDGAHILTVNSPLIKLYRLAYTGRDFANFFSSNRIIAEGFDEEELDSRKSGLDYIDWMEEGDKVFGYELIAPPGVDQYALMRQDLDRYFPHIKAEVQLRKRTVLALVQPEGFRYPPSEADEKHYRVRPYEADLQKSLLTGLIYQMNLYFLQRSPFPLIDKTGIDYPIDIRLEGNFSKVEELTAAFRKVGLDLVQREEEIPVLILTKINPLH